MFNNINNDSEDAGVSPVIGVILMVAITVILAAVIGTFVLDLAGNVEQNAQASVSFDQSQTEMIDTSNDGNADTQAYSVTAQAISMQSADNVYVEGNDTDDTTYDDDGDTSNSMTAYDPTTPADSDRYTLGSVGESATVSQLTAGDTVTVTGELNGNETVLQTYTVSE